MGVMYSVFPLQPELCEWLDEQGVAYPDVPSRNPRLQELKAVIAARPQWGAEISDEVMGKSWNALLTGIPQAGHEPWCVLQIIALQPGENEFYFENGDPVMILDFLIELCEFTGPLVLISDAGDLPLLVQAGERAQVLFDDWGNDAD